MAKWIVTVYFRDESKQPTKAEFDDDDKKNELVEAGRVLMQKGEVSHMTVEEPATQGMARIS